MHTAKYHGAKFEKIRIRGTAEYVDTAFDECSFENCSMGRRDSDGAAVERITLVQCVLRDCSIYRTDITDAEMLGCCIEGVVRVEGCRLRRVRIGGTTGRFLIVPSYAKEGAERASAFYENLETFALDVSEMPPGALAIRGIPPGRIVVDEGRQGFVDLSLIPTPAGWTERFQGNPLLPSIVGELTLKNQYVFVDAAQGQSEHSGLEELRAAGVLVETYRL